MTSAMPTASTCSELSLALRDFLAWRIAHAEAPIEELWHVYNTTLRAAWEAFPAAWLALRIAPTQRAPLAQVCAQIATARLWYLPFPTPEDNALETKLWEVAFALDARSRAGRDWDAACGYVSPAHRLADLYRRAGRSDAEAVALLIELSAQSVNFSSEGAGAHHQVPQLIFQGAHITDNEPREINEVRVRLALCYRLQLRDYAAEWVQTSVQIGQQRLRRGPDAPDEEFVLIKEQKQSA